MANPMLRGPPGFLRSSCLKKAGMQVRRFAWTEKEGEYH